MKKILSLLLLVLILGSTLSFGVCADGGKAEVVIGSNFENIIYNGNEFLPLKNDTPYYRNSFVNDTSHYLYDIEFESKSDENFYKDLSVEVYDNCDYIIDTVFYNYQNGYEEKEFFIEKTHYEEYAKIKKGESDSYSTESYYDIKFPLSKQDIENWLKSEKVTVPGRSLLYDETHPLYSVDKNGEFYYQIGLIIRVGGDYSLLLYTEYDRSYFYSDGLFAFESTPITIYKLEDKDLARVLTSNYDETPDDELDWLVSPDVSDTVVLIASIILFGILPFAVVVVSLIFAIKKKTKKPYRICLYVMAGAGVIIIAAFITVLNFLI